MVHALILAATLTTTPFKSFDVHVVDCYDGDTCTINVMLGMGAALLDQTIRLCDVNAPEIRPLATREAGTKVRDWLRAKLLNAKAVKVVIPVKADCARGDGLVCEKKDSFGRWLAYVFADGENVNQALLTLEGVEPFEKSCGLPASTVTNAE